jgi:hypothetical protein
MGSLGADIILDASPVQRSKEENQERAFVAASRRKDRSLDARLESANRASMLHKKRTGKALHITKEIVEREAMYEEIDERYHEKRLNILKAHTTELEAQFHRHLMATMAKSNNIIRQQQQQHQQQQNRVSPHGGIQKMRNLSVGSCSDFIAATRSMHIQTSPVPISPGTSPTSPVFGIYGGAVSSSSETPSPCVQTPSSGCHISTTPMTCPQYIDTGLLSPSVSPKANNMYQQYIDSLQAMQMKSAPMTQAPSSNTTQYSRPRFASYPDIFTLQSQPMLATPLLSIDVNNRASSEPSATPSPVTPGVNSAIPLENKLLSSPAIQPHIDSSQSITTTTSSCSDNTNSTQYQTQDLPTTQMQMQIHDVDLFKHYLLSDNLDLDYNDFLNFASSMEDQWQYPVGSIPFDDYLNMENLEYELASPGMYRQF